MFSLRFTFQLAAWFTASACFVCSHAAASVSEETAVFAGKCPNGDGYRLFAYQKQTEGMSLSYYDYTGPAGKGTVQSEATPRVMAVRICRPSAEIISTRYWE